MSSNGTGGNNSNITAIAGNWIEAIGTLITAIGSTPSTMFSQQTLTDFNIIGNILEAGGTATFHLTFHRLWWIVRAGISVVFLVLVAVFTERYKIYLPTRHYSSVEMLYSIMGAMAGFLFVSLVTLFYSLGKKMGNLI